MADDAEPELIPRLYDQLQDRLRSHDKDGAIEAYYQLFLAGRPLDEIISKGTRDQVGSHSDQQHPVEAAPVEPVAHARGGPVVSDETQAANANSLAPGSGITSGAQTVDAASVSKIDEQLWFVRHRRWVVGVQIGFVALVAPIMFVNSTNVEKVAVAIKRATEIVRFAVTSASTAPAEPGPTAAELTAQLNATLPSPPADASGQRTAASAEAAPTLPVAAAAALEVVGAGEGGGQLDTAKPPQSADTSGGMTAATVELAPNPPVAAAAAPKVAAAGEGKGPLDTAKPPQPADTSGNVTAATVEAAPNPPVAAAAARKIVVAVKTAHGGEPGQSELKAETLVSRGDALLGIGDLTTARLFYRRGADLGDGTAALRLGETFDPAFVQQAGLGRVAGDVKTALYWYHWAHDLGNGDADLLTKALTSPGSNEQ